MEDLKKLTKDELYSRIESYSGDKWQGSPEYKELNRRLNSYSFDRLKEEDYFIPTNLYPDSKVIEKPKKK